MPFWVYMAGHFLLSLGSEQQGRVSPRQSMIRQHDFEPYLSQRRGLVPDLILMEALSGVSRAGRQRWCGQLGPLRSVPWEEWDEGRSPSSDVWRVMRTFAEVLRMVVWAAREGETGKKNGIEQVHHNRSFQDRTSTLDMSKRKLRTRARMTCTEGKEG